MATGSDIPEYEIFQKNLHSISKGILPELVEFASKAVERSLLAPDKLDEILKSPKTIETALKLTLILLQRIEQNSSEFYEILEILKSMPTLAPVVNMLQSQNDLPQVSLSHTSRTRSIATPTSTATQTESTGKPSQPSSPPPTLSAASLPESSSNESAALDPKIRMDLGYQLRRNLETIKEQFASYVSEIYGRIKAKEIDLAKIKHFLEHQLNSDLDRVNSLDDIFRLLRRRDKTSFHFLNYHIYESLRKKCIPEETDESFNYPDYLKAYANKHRLSEFLEINPKLEEINTSGNILHIKFDIQASDKLGKVLELQESLAAVLEVRPSELQILNIEQGCVMVTFLIPAHVAKVAFQHVTEFTQEQLAKLSVKWIKLGDSRKTEEKETALPATFLLDQSTHKPDHKMAATVGPQWSDLSGKVVYSARGKRDVLLIVSEDDLSHPDVVPRRPAIELTQQLREKLENQGIARDQQGDDVTIMKARYSRDKRYTIHGVEMSQPGGERVTRESVVKHISTLMNNHDDTAGGVDLYYTGPGKRNTGDWCFEDGFITFRDLTDLYLQLLRGRVLTIVTDCSHSGCWIKQCMTFLDEQGVGPCGHSARDKEILIKVFASCLSHQVPRHFAFSVHGCKNDKNTGDLMGRHMWDYLELHSNIADTQHPRYLDNTEVRCGTVPDWTEGIGYIPPKHTELRHEKIRLDRFDEEHAHSQVKNPVLTAVNRSFTFSLKGGRQDSIHDECLCMPQADWQIWSKRNRIYTVNGRDGGREVWHIVLTANDDETILHFLERVESGHMDLEDYGQVLKSGWGEGPTDEERAAVMKPYEIYKSKLKD